MGVEHIMEDLLNRIEHQIEQNKKATAPISGPLCAFSLFLKLLQQFSININFSVGLKKTEDLSGISYLSL